MMDTTLLGCARASAVSNRPIVVGSLSSDETRCTVVS
jgi:hypothetical protein